MPIASNEILKQTPLHAQHRQLGAKMVPFGGWDMPVQYEGILAEYEATRKGCAVFDTSHMGEFIVEGDAVASGLDRIVTQRIKDLGLHACRYGFALNEKGGVIDDLIVFRLAEERWLVVVNAGTMPKDAAHFKAHVSSLGKLTNISERTAKLDVQGPRSRELLLKIIPGLERLAYYTFDEFDVLGEHVIVSRTGYTGELGYEIYYPWDKVVGLWKKILDLGVQPAGLGARDVLRLEMGYPLYGHELSEAMTPLSTGLGMFVDGEKNFIGKNALQNLRQSGITKKAIGIMAESRRSPRAGQKIFSAEGREIGVVTSGTFSPAWARGIGLGLVEIDYAKTGEKVFFGEVPPGAVAEIVKKPFYTKGTYKS